MARRGLFKMVPQVMGMLVFNPHEKSRYIYHKPKSFELLELCSHMFANYGTMGHHLVTITMKCVTGTEIQKMMTFCNKTLACVLLSQCLPVE